MVATSKPNELTPEEYLEGEQFSQVKHEYIQGKLYAMSGASDSHVTITGNIFGCLRPHLRGSGCRVYFMDMKARIESLNIFYYPDLLVTCDPRDRAFEYYKCFPKLIIEVLSNSTEAYDRGDKFAHYRQLESLEEYVLVSQKRPQIECFRRDSEGRWVLYPYTVGETIALASIGWQGAISHWYEDVV